MLTPLMVAGLMLALRAGVAAPMADRSSPAARIARAEAELCLPRCPPVPDEASSDWLRSPEGRKANACAMSCRLEPPAAALFGKMVDLATSKSFDPESPAVKALGNGAPELMRRLRAATRETEGKPLGRLCARARASGTQSGELAYLECTGRAALPAGADTLPPPEPLRALTCAVTFAEGEADWLTRCPALERRAEAGIEACAREDDAPPGWRARCERDAVADLARAFRRRPRR